jgi:pimeloyl-ACP methyl ester carboxylesterase
MFERKIASVDSSKISYFERGIGTPLVLLHGIGSAALSWKNQLASLSITHRVIAWDAPGYGESTALPEPAPRSVDYAARLTEFLRERGIDAFHLVGHSLGSLIAARFAADNPERIRSLTLASIATGHARMSEEERARLKSARLDDLANLGPRGMAEKRGPRLVSPAATPGVRQAVIDTMASIRPDGYAQAVRMLSQGDVAADVVRLAAKMPVQIVFGSADVVTPPDQNRRVAALRPSAPVHEVPNAGHALYLEQPAIFNHLLTTFLTEREKLEREESR